MSLADKLNIYRQKKASYQWKPNKEQLENLMQLIDFESTMARLGIEVRQVNKTGEYVGYCPDHEMYRGSAPSDPKWYINSNTGLTFCQTESRGSNIVEVAKHIWGLSSNKEAYHRLLDGKPMEIRFKHKIESKKQELSDPEKLRLSLEKIYPIFEQGKLNEMTIEYFARDGITVETLKKFGVVSCEQGFYKNRAIVPFFDSKIELMGYVAIDLLGKHKWAENSAKSICLAEGIDDFEAVYNDRLKKYRKTLYAPGFNGRTHLYGLYEHLSLNGSRPRGIVIVEGERDCLKLLQEGIPCISCHGTSLKEEQITELKASGIFGGLEKIYLGFDMDEAGNKATEKAIEKLQHEIDSDKIFVLNFSDNKDPKKFSRKELLQIIRESLHKKIRSR